VTIFATAGTAALAVHALLAHGVSLALTAGSVMLAVALALALVVVLIVRPHGAAPWSEGAAAQPGSGRSVRSGWWR
jgi:hypothetical protein